MRSLTALYYSLFFFFGVFPVASLLIDIEFLKHWMFIVEMLMVTMLFVLLLLPVVDVCLQRVYFCLLKYSLLMSTPGLIVSLPGFHPAGQTSPCLSVNWNACTRRRVSSTDRPTGRSFTVIWRSTPLSLITNRPLSEIPSSSSSTP